MLKYLITDPKYYQSFKTTLTNSIEKYKPDYICFRDKTSTKNAKLSIEIANYYKIPIVVNQYIELVKLGFDGVHLTSQQLHLIDEFKNYLTFSSTHNLDEVKKAYNSDYITFSPIFKSKGREGLGVKRLEEISKIKKDVFGLGGIVTDKEVEKLSKSGAIGFASIRYFL